MKKANVRISVSGIKNSLIHLEARKDSHPNETLFITWCKISDKRGQSEALYHYGWQLMHQGQIVSGDGSARPVTHEELGRNVEELISNTFIDSTFQHVDQEDYLLMD